MSQYLQIPVVSYSAKLPFALYNYPLYFFPQWIKLQRKAFKTLIKTPIPENKIALTSGVASPIQGCSLSFFFGRLSLIKSEGWKKI